MTISLTLHSLISYPPTHLRRPNPMPTRPFYFPRHPKVLLSIKSLQGGHEQPTAKKPRWENLLNTAASLYPLYVTAGTIVACSRPSTFSWFASRRPASYTFALALIMLLMGLTLELRDLVNLLLQRPLSIIFGCVAQYTIMPALGAIVSKALGLQPALSVGLILLSCCPTGTSSNMVTFIARGDMPLSIVMTVCTTLSAVILTPLLTKVLAGAYVPVDAIGLSVSTLQVVVAPILLGSYMQRTFPSLVKLVTPFSPLLAGLVASLLASSIFSENIVLLKSSMLSATAGSSSSLPFGLQGISSRQLGLITVSVMLLHFAGFFVGYLAAAICGFKEPQRRAISIEVGMQNTALAVVLATSYFTSPLVALPAAISTAIMNIMGGSLGFIWGHIDPSYNKK